MAGQVLNLGIDLLADKFIETSGVGGAIAEFKVGIGLTAPTGADTDIEIGVPITDGTVNDNGDNTLTGSSGGDNSTDNTTTFKQGAGASDDTAQNLIANNGNATKIWTIADLSSLGNNIVQTLPAAIWLFIKDSTALAKFKSSGTAVEYKLGSDSSNYFSKTYTASQLAVGWNWLTTGVTAVEDLTETGTVSGDVDTFIIEITTNNGTDTFVAGDVIYDLLRTWATSDLTKTFESGFPSYSSSTKEIQSRMILTATEANGFDISEIVVRNIAGTAWTRDLLTTAFSKSRTEELRFTQKDRFTSN